MDRRIRGGIGIAANNLGKWRTDGVAVHVLFGAISFGVHVAIVLLLFLLPAIWGVRRGLQIARIKMSSALVLAVGVTVLTMPAWGTSGPWIPNWALSWPAWYLVLTARKNGREAQRA